MTADLAVLLVKEGKELAAGEKIDFEVQLRVVGDLFLAKNPLLYKNDCRFGLCLKSKPLTEG